MRNSNRNAKALAILSAAAGLALTTQFATAVTTTWDPTKGGNWSVGSNWQGGVAPLAGTDEQFTGTTGTSNNDTALSYGTLTVTAGTNTLTNSGGGTFSNFVMSAGTATFSGTNWTMTSGNRHNDFITGNNTGRWSVDIGDTAGGTSRFAMIGGTMNAPGIFLGTDGAGTSNNIATFSSGAIVNTGTAGRFGISESTGTINILSGAQVTSRLVDVGRQGDPHFPPANNVTAFLSIDGTNSQVTSAQLVLPRNTGVGTLSITNGGKWVGQAFDTIAGNVFIESLKNGRGTGTVTGAGSSMVIPGTFITAGGAADAVTADPFAAGTSNFTVSNGGLLKAQSFNFGQNLNGNTTFVADGTTTLVTTIGAGAGTGGWGVAGNLGLVGPDAGGNTDIVNITFQNGAQATMGGAISTGIHFNSTTDPNSGGGQAIITVNSGASVNATGNSFLSLTNQGTGFTSVTCNGGSFGTSNSLITGGGYSDAGTGDAVQGGNSTFNISNGGQLRAEAMNFGQNKDNFTTIVVDGATSQMTSTGIGAGTGSWVTANNIGGTIATPNRVSMTFQNGATGSLPGSLWGSGGIATAGGGISTFTVQSGGHLNAGGFIILAPDPNGSISSLTVTGANSTFSAGTSLLVGGNGTITGGTATATITAGGAGTINNTLFVYQNSTLTVGVGTNAGSLRVNGDSGVDGWIAYNAGTFNTVGTLAVAGRVQLSDAGRGVNGVPTNKKTLEAGKLDFTTTGIVDLNDNDGLIHNNTLAEVETFIKTGRNGGFWNGTMLVSTAAKNNANKTTGLGVITGANYSATHGGTTSFNGRAIVATDKVVKYTYNGDSDLSGKVDGADYARIDTSFNNQVTQGNIGGWFNGDSDYSGKIDGADYALIDAAFNSQGTVVLGTNNGGLAGPDNLGPTDRIHSIGARNAQTVAMAINHEIWAPSVIEDGSGAGPAGSVVPEPGVLGLVGVSMLGAMSRRRRSR